MRLPLFGCPANEFGEPRAEGSPPTRTLPPSVVASPLPVLRGRRQRKRVCQSASSPYDLSFHKQASYTISLFLPFHGRKGGRGDRGARSAEPNIPTTVNYYVFGYRLDAQPKGEEVFEAYIENKTPAAYRIFWHYGAEQGTITIIAITPHQKQIEFSLLRSVGEERTSECF